MNHRIPFNLLFINKKKRTRHLVYFAVQVDDRVTIKEYETIVKFVDLFTELKKTAEHETEGDINGVQ